METTRTRASLQRMPFTRTLATATASALLAGGAVAYTGVAAETHAPAKKPPQTQGQKRDKRQARVDARRTALAQRLGVTSDQLQAAQGALVKQALDKRVANGRLTAAEETAILACRAAPLTCDRTDLPAKAHTKKANAKRAARRKANATKRIDRRATALAGELHVDRAKVLSALEAQRKAQHK
jgi:hypothetical protein